MYTPFFMNRRYPDPDITACVGLSRLEITQILMETCVGLSRLEITQILIET